MVEPLAHRSDEYAQSRKPCGGGAGRRKYGFVGSARCAVAAPDARCGPRQRRRPVRVTSGEGNIAIDQDQRQRLMTGTLQKALNRSVFSEGRRLLGKIKALDLRAVLVRPVDVRREGDKRLIGFDAADAGAAIKRGIENRMVVMVVSFRIWE